MSYNLVDPTTGDLMQVAGGVLYADTPIGVVQATFDTTAPLGWLLLQGQTISRSEYSGLLAWVTKRNLIGTGKPFGEGDGTTTFVLPDCREATLKGAGLTSKSSNHYDSDGLAVGEFIDDRVQEHKHYRYTDGTNGWMRELELGDSGYYIGMSDTSHENAPPIGYVYDARKGATTEVKAVGVNYIIKAKQAALPADFMAAVDDAIKSAQMPSIVLRTSPISRGYVVVYLPKGVTAARAILLDRFGDVLLAGSCNLVHYSSFSPEAWYVSTADLNTGFNTNLVDGDAVLLKIELTY